MGSLLLRVRQEIYDTIGQDDFGARQRAERAHTESIDFKEVPFFKRRHSNSYSIEPLLQIFKKNERAEVSEILLFFK